MRIFPGRDEGEDPLFCQMQSVCAAASIDGYDSAEFAGMLELFPAWFEFCLCGRTFFKILEILSASGSARAESGGGGRLLDVLSCFHQRVLCIFRTNQPHLQSIVKCSAALRVFINIQELLSKRSTIHLNRTA